MKLQGKKTGAFANFVGYIDQATPTIDLPTENTMLTVRYMDAGVNYYKDYKTIAEFNKDWEDYAVEEPLIKDEKIRKVVRAWADANGVKQVIIERDFSAYIFYAADSHQVSVSVWTEPSLSNLSKDKIYTIEELCGEEEE